MEYDDIKIGQVVRSIKGRDKDRAFIVVGVIDDQHVLISDGDLRRIDKPKKKKLKHLKSFNIASDEIRECVINKSNINNAFIVKELERLGVRRD